MAVGSPVSGQEKRRVTLRDVAAAANVSKTTAAFILNNRPNFAVPDETRQRVRLAAEQLGYQPNGLAAALARGKIGSIGLILPVHSSLSNATASDEYLLGLLLGATQAAGQAGLRLTVIPYEEGGSPSVKEVTDHRVDGLLLVSVLNEPFARALYATDFPCITLGSGYAERRVAVDNVGGARHGVEHLIGLGHRRIAYLGKPDQTEANLERRRGWRETLEAHGLPSGPDLDSSDALLAHLSGVSPGERATAVFCHSDALAAFAIRLLRRNGLSVPEDLSMVGFNDNVIASALDLTTVRSPLARQAAVAVDMLIRLIDGKEPETPAPLPTELIVRRSTSPAPE